MMRLLVMLHVLLVLAAARPCLADRLNAPDPGTQSPNYVIGPEDVLEIAVWDNKEISRTVPVRPDGKISLPLLDDVMAAGLTPMQLRDFLKSALTPYIPIPAVSVIVREVHSFKVTVIGEVKAPGRYALASRSTVLDVLAIAGGLTEYAGRGRIMILRRQGAGMRQIPFAFDKLVASHARNGSPAKDGSDTQDNFDLEPGDIVLVP